MSSILNNRQKREDQKTIVYSDCQSCVTAFAARGKVYVNKALDTAHE
mgnify:CR=1 FL=1